jgi:hypothetical protein
MPSFARHARGTFALALSVALGATSAACGGTSNNASTSGGTAGSGAGGSSSGGTAGVSSGGTSSGGSGGSTTSGTTVLSLPQLVHGAAYLDKLAFPQAPVVVSVSGDPPDTVDVKIDDKVTPAVKDGDHFVATIDATGLLAGPHKLVAEAKTGISTATAEGTLVTDSGSFQLTQFAQIGPAYDSQIVHDAASDSLAFTWVGSPAGKHQFFLSRLDGAFARVAKDDVVLNDTKDEPLSAFASIGKDAIGVVYRTAKAGDVHWLVKMRVVDPKGAELVPTMDLTQGEAAFSQIRGGADPAGFSAAWLHISPPQDPNNPPPVEVRFARWDTAAKKLVGPITLDQDQPQPAGSMQGPQLLEPLAELGMACNDKVCLVTYSRDVYNALVDLNIPKLFLAVVDLSTGKLAAPPAPVAVKDWDTQMFGHDVVALADGSFVLVYTANDTKAAVTPKSPCDSMLERDLLFAVKIDATGALQGKPKPIFDFEGTREYPRIAAHPAGFALFWEDQRSECNPNGHIRMAFDVAAPDLLSLLDPYLEAPGSVGLPPEDPALAVTGSNFVAAWSDNRHGNGILEPKSEIYLDTYWRK